MQSSPRAAMAVIAFSAVLWGTSFVAMKIGLEYVDPYTFAFLRLVTAFAISAAFLSVKERPSVNVLRDRSIWILGALNAGGFICQYVGLTYTTATRTALITNSNVAVTALLSWKIHREQMGVAKVLALPMAVLGVFLVTTGGNLTALLGGQAIGDLLVVVASLLWSVFLVLNKGMVSKDNTVISQMVMWVVLATTIGTFPFALALGDVGRVVVPWEGWAAVIYTAIFCTLVPYLLFARAQRHVSVTIASLVLLIEIVVAIVTSTLLLGEQFVLGSGLGAALICGSIILASRNSS